MLLHIFPLGLMITFSLLYGSTLGWRAVVGYWGAFIAATVVVGSVLHAPMLALLLKVGVALAMLVKGQLGGSSSFR